MRLFPRSASLSPEFATRPVISPDPFAYVRLKLQRQHQEDALIYWRQAEEFFHASSMLSAAASPLTSYYCMLNAVKALLTVRAQPHSASHGLSGEHTNGPVSLSGELVCVSSGGVFPAVVALYGGPVVAGQRYRLRDLLSELPFVHRSYTLTYTGATDLFVPLERARFVRKDTGTEAWFAARVPASYAAHRLALPDGFEQDGGGEQELAIRCARRFRWDDNELDASLARLQNYHQRLRKEVVPILTTQSPRWYLRRSANRGPAFELPLAAKMFAAMHRLSELSRYDPIRLSRHLEAKHNWLLNEFLAQAPAQLVHLVAVELAGREFIHPDSVRLPQR